MIRQPLYTFAAIAGAIGLVLNGTAGAARILSGNIAEHDLELIGAAPAVAVAAQLDYPSASYPPGTVPKVQL